MTISAIILLIIIFLNIFLKILYFKFVVVVLKKAVDKLFYFVKFLYKKNECKLINY